MVGQLQTYDHDLIAVSLLIWVIFFQRFYLRVQTHSELIIKFDCRLTVAKKIQSFGIF